MIIQLLVLGTGLVFGISNQKYRQKFIPKPYKPYLYKKGRTSLRAIKKIISISTRGSPLHHQQMDTIHSNYQPNHDEIKLNNKIKGSVALMGLSVIGSLLYAPLLPIAGVATLYIFTPVFKKLFQHLKKGQITTELIETVSVFSLLATGYFFLAIFITFTSLLCQKLLIRTEHHSHQQLINTFNPQQQSVWLFDDGAEVEVALETIKSEDIIVINTGEVIPVDGIVIEGLASIDQHSLTGESRPIEVEVGGKVLASTLVLSGRILIKVENTASQTKAAKIGLILEQTQEYKESIRLRGKKMADDFIAPTLAVSGLTLPLFGSSAAIAVIWSAFGYNMKLYGPISVLNFLHIMAQHGILIKDGRSLEMLQQIDTLVFDKTGTLTKEQPELTKVHPLASFDENTLLAYAAAAECRQSHPIAKAILAAAKERQLDLPTTEDAAYHVGYGITMTIDNKKVHVGSTRYMAQQNIQLSDDVDRLKIKSDNKGVSLVYIAINNVLAGMLQLQACVRPEAVDIINHIQSLGITVMIISGDHEQPTRELANQLGITHYFSETAPDEKAGIIKNLRDNGKFVAYVGDGINDAIALKQAHVSISLRGASTIATDTAQIILMEGNLKKLKALFKISTDFKANMQTNYLTSIVPGGITLIGVFLFHMGLAGGLAIYFSAKAVGLVNTMLPLAKEE